MSRLAQMSAVLQGSVLLWLSRCPSRPAAHRPQCPVRHWAEAHLLQRHLSLAAVSTGTWARTRVHLCRLLAMSYCLPFQNAELLCTSSTSKHHWAWARPSKFRFLPCRMGVNNSPCQSRGFSGGQESLALLFALARVRPNPSIERTPYGMLRMPPVAAHVERWQKGQNTAATDTFAHRVERHAHDPSANEQPQAGLSRTHPYLRRFYDTRSCPR